MKKKNPNAIYYEYNILTEVVQHNGYFISTGILMALAPGHQKPQCWVCTHKFPAVYRLFPE